MNEAVFGILALFLLLTFFLTGIEIGFAMAIVGFALERDRLYTVVSLIVLLILAFSLIHAT